VTEGIETVLRHRQQALANGWHLSAMSGEIALCRPPRKRHKQDPPRIGAVDDEVRYPVRQGVGFAGTGTGNDQKRATQGAIAIRNAMLYRTALLSIEGIERGGCQGHDRIILHMEFRRSRISGSFAMTPMMAGAAYLDR
jgi:hypothetical protein